MTTEGLLIPYKEPELPDSENTVTFEQKDWDPYEGKLTNTTLVNAIANMLYSEPSDNESESSLGSKLTLTSGIFPTNIICDSNINGDMIVEVYSYPSPYNLEYNVNLSHGYIKKTEYFEEIFTELVSVRLQNPDEPVSPSYPVKSAIGYEWLYKTWDEKGNEVVFPNIKFKGSKFYISERVYGEIVVVYRVVRRKHTLIIPMRVEYEDTEDYDLMYHSVIYALFKGGVSWEKLNVSPSMNTNTSLCGATVKINTPDGYPYSDGRDKYTKYDYCSGDKTDEYYF